MIVGRSAGNRKPSDCGGGCGEFRRGCCSGAGECRRGGRSRCRELASTRTSAPNAATWSSMASIRDARAAGWLIVGRRACAQAFCWRSSCTISGFVSRGALLLVLAQNAVQILGRRRLALRRRPRRARPRARKIQDAPLVLCPCEFHLELRVQARRLAAPAVVELPRRAPRRRRRRARRLLCRAREDAGGARPPRAAGPSPRSGPSAPPPSRCPTAGRRSKTPRAGGRCSTAAQRAAGPSCRAPRA